jgi:hypothetical protein
MDDDRRGRMFHRTKQIVVLGGIDCLDYLQTTWHGTIFCCEIGHPRSLAVMFAGFSISTINYTLIIFCAKLKGFPYEKSRCLPTS